MRALALAALAVFPFASHALAQGIGTPGIGTPVTGTPVTGTPARPPATVPSASGYFCYSGSGRFGAEMISGKLTMAALPAIFASCQPGDTISLRNAQGGSFAALLCDFARPMVSAGSDTVCVLAAMCKER
jgi:hypothetical protein